MALYDMLLLVILLHMCFNVNILVIFILSILLFLIWYVFWGINGSPDVPKKLSPRAARPLNRAALEPDSSSSPISAKNRILSLFSMFKSPQVPDRRSPHSPVSEKKRQSRIKELESPVSQLQEELKKTELKFISEENDHLLLKKNQKDTDAEAELKQLREVIKKFKVDMMDKEKQLQIVSDQNETLKSDIHKRETDVQDVLMKLIIAKEEADESSQRAVRVTEQLHATKASNSEMKTELDEVKARLVAKETELKSISEEKDNLYILLKKNHKVTDAELNRLMAVEKLKADLMDKETQLQIVLDQNETLKSDIHKRETDVQDVLMKLVTAMEEADESSQRAVRVTEQLDATQASNSEMKTELDELKKRLVAKEIELKFILEEKDNLYILKKNQKETDDEHELNQLRETIEKLKAHLMDKETQLQIVSDQNETLKSDILKKETDVQDALMKLGIAMEETEKISQRADKVTEQLDATQASNSEMEIELDELKAKLVAKETEIKFISEEKDNILLKKNHKEIDVEAELYQLREAVEKLKADLMDKETQLQIISAEKETLKSDIHKREADVQDALTKLEVAIEEADKSSQRAVRVTEQLDATQASNSQMETELRALKVQSEQWRKGAEEATAMLSAGNNYNQTKSPYSEKIDDGVQRRKLRMRLRRLVFCGRMPRNSWRMQH